MFGGGLGKTVIGHVREWIPADNHGEKSAFREDLQAFLDDQLNDDIGGMGTSNFGGTTPVRTDHGPVEADVVVGDDVGILLVCEVTSADLERLPDRIEAYKQEYDFVPVVACGVRDTAGWAELVDDYRNETFSVTAGPELQFLHKKKSEFGTRRPDSGRGTDGFLDGWL